jgi:hypothetical protein
MVVILPSLEANDQGSAPRRNAFAVNSGKYGNSSRNWSESSIA